MKSKDSELIAEAYQKVLNEQGYEGNIVDKLYNLMSSLDQEAVTKSGRPIRKALYDIITELGEAVDAALDQTSTDPEKALHFLLNKLRLD